MAYNFKDLIAWQLANALRLKVISMTRSGEVRKDFRFVSDIRGSARSVAANIAEGHGRFNPGEFHRFLEISKASLEETENHLLDGVSSSYFSKVEHEDAHTLVRRLTVAMARLMKYLRSEQAKANAKAIRKRQTPEPE
jgi:four helix bundle protein